MDAAEKQLLLDAVNLLIQAPNALELYAAMTDLAPVYAQHPFSVSLAGEAAALQPLLRLKAADASKFERTLELVEQHRSTRGLPKLRSVSSKTQYIREFMAAKRERLRQALAIENAKRGPQDAIKGMARINFLDQKGMAWKSELDARIEEARQAHRKTAGERASLPQPMMDKVRKEFWEGIDADLQRQKQEVELTQRTNALNELVAALG